MARKLPFPILFFSVLLLGETNAQNNTSFLSPGIKLGYVFGNNGGFTYGIEVSYVYMFRSSSSGAGLSVGPVLNIDFFNDFSRFHLGVQGAYGAGVCAGPTLVVKDGKQRWGYSAIAFLGAYAYPYYNFTSTEELTFHEAGAYIKYHVHTGAGTFNFID